MLNMRRSVCFLAWYLIFGSAGFCTDQSDSALLDAIVECMKYVDGKLKCLTVSGHAVSKYNFCETGIEPERHLLIDGHAVAAKHSSNMVWFVREDGSGRYEAVSDITTIGFDKLTVEKRQRFLSVFDGPRARGQFVVTTLSADGSWNGEERPTSTFVRGHMKPTEFVTEFTTKKTFSEATVENQVQIVGTQTWQGQSLLVLESKQPTEDAPDRQMYFQLWFDDAKKSIVRKRVFVRQGVGLPWNLVHQIQCLDYEYFDDVDIWLPNDVHVWNWSVSKDGTKYLSWETHVTFEDWEINKPIQDDVFSFDSPLQALRLAPSEQESSTNR